MRKMQKFGSLVSGILLLIGGAYMITETEEGYMLIVNVIALYLLVYGIRMLVYYFTMARYMVEGRMVLYKGVIAVDLGIFVGALTSVPKFYIMIFLLLINLFDSVLEILKAVDEKKLGAARWKHDLIFALIGLALSIDYIFINGDEKMLVILFASILLVNGIRKISEAFKNTSIVYIQ